jgi:hypothetical protein
VTRPKKNVRHLKLIPSVTIGGFLLSKRPEDPGKIWIVRMDGPQEGEGGTFREEALEELIETFFQIHS